MIIKGSHKNPLVFILKTLLILLIMGAFTIVLTQKNSKKQQSKKHQLFCDAETIKDNQYFYNGSYYGNAKNQTSKKSKSGKHSSKTFDSDSVAFSYVLKNINPGESYKATVWSLCSKEQNRYIAVKSSDGNFHFKNGNRIETDGKWWQRIELIFTIPSYPLDSLIVFCYKSKEKVPAYFDDFSITLLENIKRQNTSTIFEKKLQINIDQAGSDKLKKTREKAFSRGFLIQEKGEDIKAHITNTDPVMKVKMRYKGDWLDHLMTGNASYRVELKSDQSWNGMQSFSVQHPKVRGFLREWVYHEILKKYDVLSPRYEFINLQINEGKESVYAVEEHFNKNLVEHLNRKEGPIIRFSEDRFWEGMRRSTQFRQELADASNKITAMWSSEIKPYKLKKTQKSEGLSEQFKIAQNLMLQYKYGLKKTSEIFDLDRLAKYLVITDLCMAHHALTWHNQRFYYNPVTGLLEPIAYDGFGSKSPKSHAFKPYANHVYKWGLAVGEPIDRIFYDEEFIKIYFKYLYKFSNVDFVKHLLSTLEEGIQKREKFLHSGFPKYKYDRDEILSKAKEIILHLLPFSNSLQVFTVQETEDSLHLKMYNSHSLPLEVIGSDNSLRKTSLINKHKIVYPQENGSLPVYANFTVKKNAKYIYYKLPGVDSISKTNISKWSNPKDESPRQSLMELAKNINPIYETFGNTIIFKKQVYEVKEPILIPKNKLVIIEPGCIFNFGKDAFLLSYSAIQCRGEEEDPIIFNGVDKSAGSVSILQANERSNFRFVIFRNQNTFNYNGWNHTGAVNFYESDVDLLSCKFLDNNCEDALNIVRSNFTVEFCIFSNILRDAFDADFCKGKISNSKYTNIGNDGIDFSGTIATINNCTMDKISDKGVSVGEQSTVNINGMTVNNARIGFASKDLSKLSLRNIKIDHCEEGFVAYQKKPEYGPAEIELWPYVHSNIKRLFMIEETSSLIEMK